ncbi:MAG: hypothetical protein K6B43_07315 [Treponema sp.]|nr:hypothetical protein [Treponema sp.]
MNEDERREFAEIARKIVYLANKARREGLLELEADLDTISVKSEKNTLFLKKLLSLVVDGVDNSIIRHIGGTISADEVDEYLKTEDSSMTFSEELDALLGG